MATEGIRVSSIHPRGTVVFAQGQESTGIYLLRTGRAKVSISSAEGEILVLSVAEAGTILGLNSVIKEAPYDVTVETLETARVDFVSRFDFMRILNMSDMIRRSVINLLGGELSELLERMRSLVLSQSASERLARLLLGWSESARSAALEKPSLKLGLTHEEIAQMICTSRETVTRLFGLLRRKQIVSFENNTIMVRDWNALQSMANCRVPEETS